jgi:hypothetical protein
MKNHKWMYFAGGTLVLAGLIAATVLDIPSAARAQHGPEPTAEISDRLGRARADAVDRRQARLKSGLQRLRGQVELFRLYNDRFPGIDSDGRFGRRRFAEDLASPSCGGPYLLDVPANPFVAPDRARTISAGAGPAPKDGTTGWHVDTLTLRIEANDAQSPAEQ